MLVFLMISKHPGPPCHYALQNSRYSALAALCLMVMVCGCHWVLQIRAWARDGASVGQTTRLRTGDTLRLAQLVLSLRPGNAKWWGAWHAFTSCFRNPFSFY